MSDMDLKKIVDEIRIATEMIKGARGLIRALGSLVKNIPWRRIAECSAWMLRKALQAMAAAVRLPEPWPRASLAIKTLLTAGSYVAALFCLALLIADCDLFSHTHLSLPQSAEAALFMIFTAWGTMAAFAQAEWLRFLMAKNSRILWGSRPTHHC